MRKYCQEALADLMILARDQDFHIVCPFHPTGIVNQVEVLRDDQIGRETKRVEIRKGS